MALSTRSLVLLISLPVTVCAAILYYLRKKDDETDLQDHLVEVQVPVKKLDSVIGRDGINIIKLQDQTGTKINVEDAIKAGRNDEYRVCKIRGIPENTEKAEKLLKDLINKQPEKPTTDDRISQGLNASEVIKQILPPPVPDTDKSGSDAKPTVIPRPNPGLGLTPPIKPTAPSDHTSSFIDSESNSNNKPRKPLASSDDATDLIDSESNSRRPVSRPSGPSIDLIQSESNSATPLSKPSNTSSGSPAKSNIPVSPGKPSKPKTTPTSNDSGPKFDPPSSPPPKSGIAPSSIDPGSQSVLPASPSNTSDTTKNLFNSGSKYISPASSPDKPSASELTANLLKSETDFKESPSSGVKPSSPTVRKTDFIEPGFVSKTSPSKPTDTSSAFLDSEKSNHFQ